MDNDSNKMKTITITDILRLARHTHIMDTFIDEIDEQELVVTLVSRIPFATIKADQKWKAVITNIERGESWKEINIFTTPEVRMHNANNSMGYIGHNAHRQKEFLKNKKYTLKERYKIIDTFKDQ